MLETLGYREANGCFRHPDRRAAFCGDFIDRGPQIGDVLKIVRQMVEDDAAVTVMGNHEFNAIAFATPHPDQPDEFCRPHTPKNLRQHQQTLNQLSPAELQHWIDWFRTLPVALDLDDLRIVHACWNPAAIELLNQHLQDSDRFDQSFVARAVTQGDPVFDAVESLLKGPEMPLPEGTSVYDKEGTQRRRVRIRWFEPPAGRRLAQYSLPANPGLQDINVPDDAPAVPYAADAPPVFIGHYWLSDARPTPLVSNVACLDYSVAKAGLLCAYRFNGESTLSAQQFVTVPSRDHQPTNHSNVLG